MATYIELHDLQADNEFNRRITAAVVIAADTIRTEDGGTANNANRLIWAASVFASPSAEAKRMVWAVLAANKASTAEQILSASDAVLQSAVDAAVNLFATGG